MKRDGTVLYYTLPSVVIRGMYFWEDQNKLFVAYDDKIAILTASTGVLITTVTPWITTTGEIGFTEFNYDTGIVNLVVSDGSRLITIDTTNTVVTGADPDMPSPHNPNVVFLDGYLFMIKTGTSDIYNSDVNDPLAYTSGDFISVEMLPDQLIRISRLNNYIVALGSASIEYFYDAANATGSPLNRNDTPVKQVGYLGGLAKMSNKIFFIGQTTETSPQVYMLEDFKIEDVDTPPIRRYNQPYTTYGGSIVSMTGHDFYVINVGTISYMMDLETKIWTRLSFKSGTTFPISYSVNVPVSGVGNVSIVAQTGLAALYYFNPSIYQDGGINFDVVCLTANETFDSLHVKMMSRIIVYGDKPSATTNLTLQTTDDDYQTYSTARTVDLYLESPTLTRWGRFKRRAFKLTYSDNFPLRLHHLEVDYNIGNR